MKCRTDWPDANETIERNNKACRNNLRGMILLLAKVQTEIQWKHTRCSDGEHSSETAPRRSHGDHHITQPADRFPQTGEGLRRLGVSAYPPRARRSQKHLTAEEQKKVAEVTEKDSRLR